MMKVSFLTALGFALATAAHAAPGQSCIQISGGVSHVVATVEHPADCCTGRMQCSQFLSMTIVARPAQAERT
jgi:hypothetical protein